MTAEVHAECVAAYDEASRLLAELGHEVVDIEPPIPRDVVPMFEVVWTVLATLTPVPDGREGELMPLTRHLRERGAPVSGTQFAQAVGAMQAVSRAAIGSLASYDAVLTPTLADLPAPVGSLRNDDDPARGFRGAETVYAVHRTVERHRHAGREPAAAPHPAAAGRTGRPPGRRDAGRSARG